MVQFRTQRVGNLSRFMQLKQPAGLPPLPLEEAVAELRNHLKEKWDDGLMKDRETMRTAIITYDYISGGQVHQVGEPTPQRERAEIHRSRDD